ncbi:MAG: DNA pilot protein [Arizlama microvirus]|nr:MAG: DNA pilot protein [Arizlama microvirus]
MAFDPASVGFNVANSLLGLGTNALMSNWTNDQNLKNLRENREYNTPTNQVKRLKDAGLNPALMYGSSQPANVSPLVTPVQAPKSENTLGSLNEYASVENLETQNANIRANNALINAQALLTKTNAEKAGLELDYLKEQKKRGFSVDGRETGLERVLYKVVDFIDRTTKKGINSEPKLTPKDNNYGSNYGIGGEPK